MDDVGPQQPTVAEVLSLPPFFNAEWELLTPTAELTRPVRWVHTIGVPRPASLLRGHEFVLSTLPRFSEDREDLLPALRSYLEDLDSVNASALAVEVFEDRPHLLEALRTLVAQRSAYETGTASLPIILFRAEVRFVEITEHFHRYMIARQHSAADTTEAHDPLFEASTQFIRDLSGGRDSTDKAAENRAQVLGMAGAAHYRSLVLRFRTPSPLSAAERSHAQQLTARTIRATASRLRIRALVGEAAAADLAIVLALGAEPDGTEESSFCRAVSHAAGEVSAPDFIPDFIISAGEHSSNVADAVAGLSAAHQVLRSLEVILPRAARCPGFGSAAGARGYWKAEDLGVLGLLARVQEPELISWFTSAQLGRLRGPEAPALRELIRALASPTGTKAELAAALGISRPTLYARMHRLERTLGRPLDADTLTALHLALLLEDLHD